MSNKTPAMEIIPNGEFGSTMRVARDENGNIIYEDKSIDDLLADVERLCGKSVTIIDDSTGKPVLKNR